MDTKFCDDCQERRGREYQKLAAYLILICDKMYFWAAAPHESFTGRAFLGVDR